MKKIKKINFITIGILAIAALFLMNNPLILIASNSPEDEWVIPEEGRVSFVSGDVFINNNRVDEGDTLKKGDVVTTGNYSEAEIEIRDFAVFHLKENSSVLIKDVLLSPRVEVKKGWFLAIVKRGTQFEIGTPLARVDVQGTVLFVNVLNDNETYIDVCNGKVHLEEESTGALVTNVISSYHRPFILRQKGDGLDIEGADLHYHTDEDILQMADRFGRETMVIKSKKLEKSLGKYGE